MNVCMDKFEYMEGSTGVKKSVRFVKSRCGVMGGGLEFTQPEFVGSCCMPSIGFGLDMGPWRSQPDTGIQVIHHEMEWG